MLVHNVGAMTRVCVMGSVNMDIGFDVDTLPRPGETALATTVRSTPGGKGANQAVAAARAGADVQFVGAVGRGPARPRNCGSTSRQRRVHRGIAHRAGRSGNAAVIVDSAGENIIVVAPERQRSVDPDAARRGRSWRTAMWCCCSWRFRSPQRRRLPASPFGRCDRDPQRLAGGRRRERAGPAGRGDRRVGRQRNRSRTVGLAGPASGHHPRRSRGPLHRRRR